MLSKNMAYMKPRPYSLSITKNALKEKQCDKSVFLSPIQCYIKEKKPKLAQYLLTTVLISTENTHIHKRKDHKENQR